MRQLHHPELQTIALSTVLHALSDPVRLQIVRTLSECGEQCSGACEPDVPKPTMSHHFKVLREAGVTLTRAEGTQRCISLRRAEVNARFPGLLDAILQAAPPL